MIVLGLICIFWSWIGMFIGINIINKTGSYWENNPFYWHNKNLKQKAFLIFLCGPATWILLGLSVLGNNLFDLFNKAVQNIINLLK